MGVIDEVLMLCADGMCEVEGGWVSCGGGVDDLWC